MRNCIENVVSLKMLVAIACVVVTTAELECSLKTSIPTLSSCNLTVDYIAARNLSHIVYTKEANYLYVTLEFVHDKWNGTKVKFNYTDDTITPSTWIWTYDSATGAHEYLYWPHDYYITSLGLLNKHTVRDFKLPIIVTRGCDMVLGKENTTELLANTLADVVCNYFTPQLGYGYSYFCYRVKWTLKEVNYFLDRIFGIPTYNTAHKCCKFIYNLTTKHLVVDCDYQVIDQDLEWILIPFAAGMLLFLYCPLLFTEKIRRYGNKRQTMPSAQQHRYHSVNSYSTDDEDGEIQDDMITLNEWPPITVLSVMCSPITSSESRLQSNVLSRIQRLAFLYLSPIVLYVQLYVYSTKMESFTKELVDHQISMGYLSLISGFDKSISNSFILFGGPYIMFALYFTIATVLVLIPKDPAHFISKGFLFTEGFDKTLLLIDPAILESLSGANITGRFGWDMIHSVLRANFLTIINPLFWIKGFQLQNERIRRCIRSLGLENKTAENVITLLSFVIYVPICLVEWIAAILLYGFPMINFLLVCFLAFFSWRTTDDERRPGKCVFYILKFFYAIILIFVAFVFSVIFVGSFMYLSQTIAFSFIGLIVYPEISFGYALLVFAIIFHVWRCARNFSGTYHILLQRTVKAANAVCRNNHDFIQINERRQDVSVSKDLFYHVVEKVAPIRMEMAKSFVRLLVIVIIVRLFVRSILYFDREDHISIIMQSLAAVLLCLVPQVLNVVFQEANSFAMEKSQRRKVQEAVVSYLHQTGFEPNETDHTLDDDLVNIICSSDCSNKLDVPHIHGIGGNATHVQFED